MEENELEKPKKKGMPAILENAKQSLGTAIEKGKEAVKKGMETIASVLSPHDSAAISNENYTYVAEELAKKLMTYYNGALPVISGLEFKADNAAGKFDVTAKAVNLHNNSRGVQEADLKAIVEIPNPLNYVIPASDVSGMITFHPIPAQEIDLKPKIHKIDLEITNTSHIPELFQTYIRETIQTKYPHGTLIGQTGQIIFKNETDYCELFISDTAEGSKGSDKKIIRLLKFPVKKVPVEMTVDECLSIRDYECRLLPPEEIFKIDFPEPRQIRKELEKEKSVLRNQIYDKMKSGFMRVMRKPFLRIKTPARKTEPNNINAGNELSFNIEFDCVTGIGPFAKSFPVSVEFFYAIDGENIKSLRYLRHGDFIT